MSTPSSPSDLELCSQLPQPVQEYLAQNTEQDHAPLCSETPEDPEDRTLWGTPPPPSPSPSPSPKVNGNMLLALPAGAPSAVAETVFPKEDNTMPQPQESQFDPAAAANEALKSVSLELEEASKPKQPRAAAKRQPKQAAAPKRVSKRAAKPPKLLTPNQLMQQMDQERFRRLWPEWSAKWAADEAAKGPPMPVYGVPGQPYGQKPLQAAPGPYHQTAGPLYQQPLSVPPPAHPLASHLAPALNWNPTPSPPSPPQAPYYSIGLGIYNGLGQYHSAAPQPWLMQQPGLPDELVELDDFAEP